MAEAIAIGPTQFFNKTHDEAMALLQAARHYCAQLGPAESQALTPVERLKVSCETMRVTSRLTQVMAWILAQKAVHAGEISRSQAASEQFSLGGEEVCLDETGEQDHAMPERLSTLLARSRQLYVRVMRLDELVRRAAS